jgi:hypothetical protein
MASDRRRHGGEEFSRGEVLGCIGLGSALLAWIYALSRPAAVTLEDIVNVQCPPCDCAATDERYGTR